MKVYTISSNRLRVEIPRSTMSLHVTDRLTGKTWKTCDEPFDEVVLERDGVVSAHTLAESGGMTATELGAGAILFRYPEYRLQVLVTVEDDRLDVQISPEEETDYVRIKGVVYPRCFQVAQDEQAGLLVPFDQGMLIPGNWHEEAGWGSVWQFDDEARMRAHGDLFDVDVNWWSSFRPTYEPSLSNDMTMPWWAILDEAGSVLITIDEASWADSHLWVIHPPGGPSSYRLLWLPSYGRLNYPRRISFTFSDARDYVSVAQAYRSIAEARGKCLTLREKNERNPVVGTLAGAANARIRFIQHSLQRLEHKVNLGFTDAADLVESFTRATGLHLHVAAWSWQQHGHDIQYPDLVPPAPEAGGPAAFAEMVERMHALGHVVGLGGDNYHDVALDSPLLDESMLLRYADGSTNRRNFWASGATSMVCATPALKYLRRNFEIGRTDYPPVRGLLHTAKFDTYWIGNYVSTYECYDPRHPHTRSSYWDAQRRIFEYINSCGVLLNNEHPKDWAAPYFYMARTRQRRRHIYGYDRSGDVLAVPVPLWGLVYHDCLITGGDNELLCMLGGSPPSVDIQKSPHEALERLRLHCRLHEAVCFERLSDHAFLSADRTRQRSSFSNGVEVEIDEAEGSYRISGVEGVPDRVFRTVTADKNYY